MGPYAVRLLLLGGEALELLGAFRSDAEKIAFARPLAFHKAFLCVAREALEELLVFLRPRLGGSMGEFWARIASCVYRGPLPGRAVPSG